MEEINYSICTSQESQISNFSIYLFQDKNTSLTQYQKFLDDKKVVDYCQLIAKKKDKVIGILSIENQPSFPVYMEYLYISGVYVLPEYRGYGIGSKLVEQALSYVKNKGCPVYLTTLGIDNNVNDFYTSKGFKLAGHWLAIDSDIN